MTQEEKINLGVQKFLNGEGTLTSIRKELGLTNTVEMSQKLTDMGVSYIYRSHSIICNWIKISSRRVYRKL